MIKRKRRNTKTPKKKNKTNNFKKRFNLLFFAVLFISLGYCSRDIDLKDSKVENLLKSGINEASSILNDVDVKLTFNKQSEEAFELPETSSEIVISLPQLEAKRKQQIIEHEGYTVSYNSDHCIANWVAYDLTAKEASSDVSDRHNRFYKDPKVKGATALNEDYSKSGFDRGHLAPAADMKWSEKAMRESFYYSNVCPQNPKLNRGLWAELEDKCRKWASEKGNIHVNTGPIITSNMRRLGKNRVAIPRYFYKVLAYQEGSNVKMLAFVFENVDPKYAKLNSFITTVDEVETLSGIDFFHALPDEMERKLESSVQTKGWEGI